MILKKCCTLKYVTKEPGLKLWSPLGFWVHEWVGKFWGSMLCILSLTISCSLMALSFISKQRTLKYFSHLSCSICPNTTSFLRARPSSSAPYLCQAGSLRRILFASFLSLLCFFPSPQHAPWQNSSNQSFVSAATTLGQMSFLACLNYC